jgi:putative oxidoreductase
MDIALLIARLSFGLGLAAHGVQKLFGWYGGYGLTQTGEFMVKLGFPSARIFGTAVALGETLGGLLLAVGLFGPFGPALMIVVMVTASLTVHLKNGFFSDKRGYELPMMYAMGALVFAFTGPGSYSLDRAFGLLGRWNEGTAWAAVGIAVVIALLNYAISRAPVFHRHARGV